MPFSADNKHANNNDMTTFKATHLRNIPSKIRDSMELYNPEDPIYQLSYESINAKESSQNLDDFFDRNQDDEEYNDHDRDDSDFHDDSIDEEDFEDEVRCIPFWFGNEDKEQLKAIIQIYSKALNLDEDEKTRVRKPPSFIGRIKRIKLNHENKFLTLDTVDVFTRSLLAPGSVMPLKKTVNTITEWSIEEGLPEKVSLVTNKAEKKSWLDKEDLNTGISYLFSFPVYGSRHLEYTYMVSDENKDVTYSPDSLCTKILYAIPDEQKDFEELSFE